MTNEFDTQGLTQSHSASAELREEFVHLAQCAADTGNHELVEAATLMADLMTIAQLFSEDSSTQERAQQILDFCRLEALPTLTDLDSDDQLTALQDQVDSRFSDCLSLLAPEERFHCQQNSNWSAENDGWDAAAANTDDPRDDDDTHDVPGNLEGILASLALESNTADSSIAVNTVSARAAGSMPNAPNEVETIDDPEMVAAFADDAQQCLAEMEASVLLLETGPAEESLRNFCRQLHTLKGASGTVGLAQLAGYLHGLESYVEASTGSDIDVDRLLEGVDAVRSQLSALGVSGAAVVPSPIVSDHSEPRNPGVTAADSAVAQKPMLTTAAANDSELFVRVEASRLERLMDLLAELVMVRNRRDTYVESLRTIHNELNHCASRTRALTSTIEFSTPGQFDVPDSSALDSERQTAKTRLLTRSLDEVSKDTQELGRSLQDVFDPLSSDNSAVSHLIGRFRQELMELRRLPMGGLFQRLQRAVRDAAKTECKQVEIHFEGQGARAERAVQERLFEPLLHLVRNAVSHGIQTKDDRVQAGKPATGRITLAAWSDAASLSIEVRDDGQGLNEEVLEARGRELGLLPPGESVTQAQVRQLIFHPGFSTRTSVSEISGRGVGMDVVDSWVRRLRGRIDVESTVGQGTTFRLQIPLRSAVEHAMVIRAGGQLFALPMHAVSGTSDSRVPVSGLPNVASAPRAVSLSCLLGCRDTQTTRGCHVTLRDSSETSRASKNDITITVDAVVGVEEVVVRSLPSLLQRNELFAGVTLSGRAETVLLLDVRRLMELSHRSERDSQSTDGESIEHEQESNHPCVLVVDDSVVVRRHLEKKLAAAGYDVCQATNGREALNVLKSTAVSAVVSDVDMPGMNGIELLQEIKRQKQLQQIPVTMLSSRDAELLANELTDLQPAAVLNKPVTDDTITAIIDSFSSCALNS